MTFFLIQHLLYYIHIIETNTVEGLKEGAAQKFADLFHEGTYERPQNKQAVTTSLQVAETFEKEVKHVNEAIKKLTVENSAVKNFFHEGTYTNGRGREYPMYCFSKSCLRIQRRQVERKKIFCFVVCKATRAVSHSNARTPHKAL